MYIYMHTTYMCDQDMLDEFGGLTNIAIYSCSVILLKMEQPLPFWFQVWL